MPGCRLLPSTIAAEKAQRPGHHGSLLRAGAYLVYSLFCPQLKPSPESLSLSLYHQVSSCQDLHLPHPQRFQSLSYSCLWPNQQPSWLLEAAWTQTSRAAFVTFLLLSSAVNCRRSYCGLQEAEMENLWESNQSSLQNAHAIFQAAGWRLPVPVVQWSARSHARGHQTSWPLQNKAVTSFHIKTQCQKNKNVFSVQVRWVRWNPRPRSAGGISP